MKSFVVASIFALASVATAQLEDIPPCALTCLLTPLQNDGCPSLEDFKCHCEKAESLFASVTPCVQKECEASDQETVIKAVEGTCAEAGVPVEVPAPGGSSAASEPASATPTPTPTEAESSAEISETPEPTPSESPAESEAVTTGEAPESTPAPSGTVSEFTGAAAQATQAAGILGAAAIALLAL